ncbi:hypothetical protein [Alteraurantiacibacter buctensis]|nr:hypothetical protein [Alteraurantiacibacter buctensis]
MSWTNRWLAAGAMAVAVLAAPQVAQAGVVVSSSGPSAGNYPVGRQIGTNDRIVLRDGDTLTVLQNGGTRVFRGAGTYVLSQASASSTNTGFQRLTTQRAASRARTGAVRGPGDTGGAPSNPSLWYVDVSTAGTRCLPDPENVRLWRGDTQADSTYALVAEGLSEGPVDASFRAGEALAIWDINHPPVAGHTYRIGHGSGASAVEVRFVFLDAVPATPEELAATLIANGCTVQLAQLASATEVTE